MVVEGFGAAASTRVANELGERESWGRKASEQQARLLASGESDAAGFPGSGSAHARFSSYKVSGFNSAP